MFPFRPLNAISLPIMGIMLAPTMTFAQIPLSDPLVAEQILAVNLGTAALKKLMDSPNSAGDEMVLDKIGKIKVATPLNATELLNTLKAITQDQMLRLLEMRIQRDRLKADIDALTASTKNPAYSAQIKITLQNSADAALKAGNARLEMKPYHTLLGESKRPGESIAALQKVYVTLSEQAALSMFGGLETDPTTTELVAKLASGLPEYVKAFKKIDDLEALAKNGAEMPVLKLLPTPEMGNPANVAFAEKVTALKAREKAIADKLPEWMGKVNEQVERRTLDVMTKANNVRRRQAGAVAFAIVERKSIDEYLVGIQKVNTAWEVSKTVILGRHKTKADDADTVAVKLKKIIEELESNVSMLTGLLGKNGQELVTMEVRLSYFPNVNELIRILNPTAKLIDPTNGQPATVAVQKRIELRQQEAKLLDARQRVSDVKTRIQRIESELAQAQAAGHRTAQAFAKAQGQLLGLADSRTKLEAALANSNDTEQRLKLQSQIDNIRAKEVIQKQAVDAVGMDNTAAQDRLKALSDEKTGLPQKREEAATELKTEEGKLNELRRDLPGLAQDESDAFAAARDNAPFYRAEPLFDDPDPLRRVFIWGNPDSRTLYLRGGRDDVAAAREAVAEFDKPTPFTRLSFYSLQLSGEDSAFKFDSKSGVVGEEAKTAFAIVDEKLDAVRSGTTQVTDALRNAIAQEINDKAYVTAQTASRMERYNFYSEHVKESLGFKPKSWGTSRGQFILADNFYDTSMVTRYTLPDPVRLTTLGEMIFIVSLGSKASRCKVRQNLETALINKFNVTQGGAPSNAHSGSDTQPSPQDNNPSSNSNTTNPSTNPRPTKGDGKQKKLKDRRDLIQNVLLHALSAVLSPNSQKWQNLFANDPDCLSVKAAEAMNSINRILGLDLVSGETTQNDKAQEKAKPLNKPMTVNLRTDEFPQENGASAIPMSPQKGSNTTGSNSNPPNCTEADIMTPAQKEILDALLAKARTDVSGTIYKLTRQLEELPVEMRYRSAFASNLREEYLPLIGWLVSDPARSPFDHLLAGNRRIDKINSWRALGLEFLIGERRILRPEPGELNRLPAQTLREMDRMAFEIARVQYIANPLSKATGRIEAADMMIRELIDTYDDDLKRLIRMPAMQAIRDAIAEKLKGVSFGGVEETSFLAANRRVARVDPLGSASLTVEEKANFAEAAQNLSNLLTKQQERVKTRDSILGAAATATIASKSGENTLNSAGLGLTSLLSSLLGASSNDAQTVAEETYSISSGNLYKVTPIFGPSGQNMRFMFDFVGTTRLREPGGTTSAALPRIERHTINTDVGLANLELRQITSFDSNYQIGIPPKYSGGLPLFNSIPGLNRIPILGYFSVRQGKPSLRQKSIIMAQSVMYPTIADICGLMLDAATLPVTFSSDPPAASRQESELSIFDGTPSITRSDPTLLPGDTLRIQVRLHRPLRDDATLKMVIPDERFLNVVGKNEQVLRRGQDTTQFLLRVPEPDEEKTPQTSPTQPNASKALPPPKQKSIQEKLSNLRKYGTLMMSPTASKVIREDAQAKYTLARADLVQNHFYFPPQHLFIEQVDETGRTEKIAFVLSQTEEIRPVEVKKGDVAIEWQDPYGRVLYTDGSDAIYAGEALVATVGLKSRMNAILDIQKVYLRYRNKQGIVVDNVQATILPEPLDGSEGDTARILLPIPNINPTHMEPEGEAELIVIVRQKEPIETWKKSQSVINPITLRLPVYIRQLPLDKPK